MAISVILFAKQEYKKQGGKQLKEGSKYVPLPRAPLALDISISSGQFANSLG